MCVSTANDTDEIARAFLVPEPTVAQRIVRAKRTLAEKQVPFEVPRGAELADREPELAVQAGGDWLPASEIAQWPPLILPQAPTLENYSGMFEDAPFGRFFLNSLGLSLLLFGASLGSLDVAMNIHAAEVELVRRFLRHQSDVEAFLLGRFGVVVVRRRHVGIEVRVERLESGRRIGRRGLGVVHGSSFAWPVQRASDAPARAQAGTLKTCLR